MDRVISDFFVAGGNDMDAELDSFHLFVMADDLRIKNNRVILRLKARDVSVRKSGGFHLVQDILGRGDLDRVRECTVDEDLFFPLREGTPSVFLGLPDTFEQLPSVIRNNRFIGVALKIAYLQKHSLDLQAQMYAEAGYQASEIQDILSQSQTKLSEFVVKQVTDMTQATENKVRDDTKGNKPNGGSQEVFY